MPHKHKLEDIIGSEKLLRKDLPGYWQGGGSKPVAGNLLSYDGDTLNVKSLAIGDIASLQMALNNKSDGGHTHTGYALADHTHTGYAAANHTHTEYANVSHTHTEYALTSHTHEYAPLVHTHQAAVPSGKFLKDDGTWDNPGGGAESEIIVRLGADVANATTSFADVTGLLFPMLANKDYVFDVWLLFQSSVTTTGIKLAVKGPGTPTVLGMQTHIPTTLVAITHGLAIAYDSGTASTGVPVINTSYLANITGLIRNGVTAGNLIIRFAAETTGTVKIMTGSILRYRQVN